MEKEIIWTAVAQKDFWEIVEYLKSSWPEKVLDRFYKTLQLKSRILQSHHTLDLKAENIPASEKLWLPAIIC